MTPNEIGDNRNNRYVDPRFKRLLWYLIGIRREVPIE